MIRRILLLVLISLPLISNANIEITEIMYDLEGTDAKREWIEIVNNGSEIVDLTDWRFNDGSNHVLNSPGENGGQGSLVLSPGEIAILASDAATFVNEYNANGTVIDTVMSLNNTEDTIALINGDGVVLSEVMYTSELGGNGNGNSLQLFGTLWNESLPTPFESNSTEEEPLEDPLEGDENPKEEEETQIVSGSGISTVPYIVADAGENLSGVVSSMIFFEGHAYGLNGDPLKNARYVWNFGDGNRKEGKNVAHTYTYPGTYRANLTVSSGEFSDTDRRDIEVGEADVEITYADRGRIEISNNSNSELDLSYWRIKYKDFFFTLPKGTFISEKSRGIFPASATNIVVGHLDELSLLYPNGTVASTFLVPIESVPIESKISSNTVNLVKEIEYVYIPQVEKNNTAETEPSTSTQAANVVAPVFTEEEASRSMYKWLLALVSVISVASLLALSAGKNLKRSELRAKDIKIVS